MNIKRTTCRLGLAGQVIFHLAGMPTTTTTQSGSVRSSPRSGSPARLVGSPVHPVTCLGSFRSGSVVWAQVPGGRLFLPVALSVPVCSLSILVGWSVAQNACRLFVGRNACRLSPAAGNAQVPPGSSVTSWSRPGPFSISGSQNWLVIIIRFGSPGLPGGNKPAHACPGHSRHCLPNHCLE